MGKIKFKNPFSSLWAKGRYKLWRNILVQLAMTVIAIGQLFCTVMVVGLLTTGTDPVSLVFGLIMFAGGAFVLSMLMVLLKGLGKTESNLPAYWYVSWDKVTPDALNEIITYMSTFYPKNRWQTISKTPTDQAKINAIEAINSVNWENDIAVNYKIKSVLRPWTFTISPARNKYWKYTLLWWACSPIAFLCQAVSLCVMCTSPKVLRTVISTGADIPISMAHLPEKQKYMRFFFNAVSIEGFEQRVWLGKYDERK